MSEAFFRGFVGAEAGVALLAPGEDAARCRWRGSTRKCRKFSCKQPEIKGALLVAAQGRRPRGTPAHSPWIRAEI